MKPNVASVVVVVAVFFVVVVVAVFFGVVVVIGVVFHIEKSKST